MNRDYKTRDRKTRQRLDKHAARMNELIALGLSREEASKKAFVELFGGNEKQKDEEPKASERLKK